VGTDFGGSAVCVPFGDCIGDRTITGGGFFDAFDLAACVSICGGALVNGPVLDSGGGAGFGGPAFMTGGSFAVGPGIISIGATCVVCNCSFGCSAISAVNPLVLVLLLWSLVDSMFVGHLVASVTSGAAIAKF